MARGIVGFAVKVHIAKVVRSTRESRIVVVTLARSLCNIAAFRTDNEAPQRRARFMDDLCLI